MKKKILLGGILLFFSSFLLHAQELKVESFSTLELDITPRTHERLDLNDVPCAVLRVSVADAKSFTFAGNIIGEIVYHPGEALIYMTDRSRKIQIHSEKFGTLEYEFPERLQKSVAYRLTLRLIVPEAKKTRTLVMPVAGIGKVPSYGIMIGIVRKWGGYAKVKYSFSGQSTSYECDADGIVSYAQEKAWFTGEKASSRFAVTAGVLYRVTLPFYLYAGVGYGYKKLAWEMADDLHPEHAWAEVTDHSYDGVESELGAIYRINNIALSLGVQNTQFGYWEGNVGIAFMF